MPCAAVDGARPVPHGTRRGRFEVEDFLPPLLLVVLAGLLRAPFFDEPPGRDQGLFMAQAWQWLAGGELYTDIWEHKPGGVIALYGLAIELGGLRPASIQWLHAGAGALTALGLFVAARRCDLHVVAATLAGVFYLVFFGGPLFGGFWATAQVEVFVDPLVALLLVLLVAGDGSPSRGRCFVSGLVLGLVVFWLKPSCLPLLVLALLLWVPRREGHRHVVSAGVALVLGFAAVGSATLLYFAATERLEDFWRATVVFNWAHRQVAAPGLQQGALWGRLFPFFGALWVLYGLATWALVARGFSARHEPARDRLLWAGVLLFVAAIAQVFWQGKFWVYHYHVVVLPLSLLAACGVQALAQGLARGGRAGLAAWGVALFSLVLVGLAYGPVLEAYARQHRLVERWQGELPDDAWHATYLWGGTDYDFSETRAAARHLSEASPPGSRLFVWGFEPSLYWLAERAPSSRFFYDYPFSPGFGEIASQLEAQLLDDLAARPPATVVVVSRDANDLEQWSSDRQLPQHPELAAWLARQYEPRWRVGDFTGYERSGVSDPLPSGSASP